MFAQMQVKSIKLHFLLGILIAMFIFVRQVNSVSTDEILSGNVENFIIN